MQLDFTDTRAPLPTWIFGSLFILKTQIVAVLKKFGFDLPELSPQLFLQEKQIIRMGVPPVKLEICTSISGVEFAACFEKRIVTELDGVDQLERSQSQQKSQWEIERYNRPRKIAVDYPQ